MDTVMNESKRLLKSADKINDKQLGRVNYFGNAFVLDKSNIHRRVHIHMHIQVHYNPVTADFLPKYYVGP